MFAAHERRERGHVGKNERGERQTRTDGRAEEGRGWEGCVRTRVRAGMRVGGREEGGREGGRERETM